MKKLKEKAGFEKNKQVRKFNINFYKKVQKGFLKISKNNKKYLIIDSNKNINDNKSKVINKLKKILNIK